MRIITKTILKNYYEQNPLSKNAITDWIEKVEKAHWTCFDDIRKTFATVSSVGNQHYVFNIKANDYRLVVVIQFTHEVVYIRFIGTHKEYDNIKDIKNI